MESGIEKVARYCGLIAPKILIPPPREDKTEPYGIDPKISVKGETGTSPIVPHRVAV